jgi:hypothetical protein
VAFDVAELAQRLAEAVPHRRVVDDPDAHYTRALLRACHQRPHGRRAGDERYEFAPSESYGAHC